MNIFTYLFEKFFYLQKGSMIGVFVLSLILSFFYANISSKINANIIQYIQKNHHAEALVYVSYFIGISILFFIVLYIYKIIQNKLLTSLSHWSKQELFEFILKMNNENMSNVNFVDFITPITRISNSAAMLLNDILTNIIPSMGFIIVIAVYFAMKNWKLGVGFIVANLLIFAYLFFFWKPMVEYKRKQEIIVVENERYILDILNNLEKVLYRGEMNREIELFKEKTDHCIEYTTKMIGYMNNHVFVMSGMSYVVLFGSLYFVIKMHENKEIDTLTMITFLTILIMYRDNISDSIHGIPYNIESWGRIELILNEFNDMVGQSSEDIKTVMHKKTHYEKIELPFDNISFSNVSFAYGNGQKTVFSQYNKDLAIDNKIIGITGLSGNGKSSFVKLIMRLHDCSEGTISIDGTDIKTIDPFYIRENITYVNQNSKLFDRKVLENILYGCKDMDACNGHLKEIMAYSKIQELYRNVKLETYAGPLGENLSGGQRQVVNIISGLINPTKILILDEPTNALDPELKREILAIIQHFRPYKKCIMIITHDRDVYSLFDETLEI